MKTMFRLICMIAVIAVLLCGCNPGSEPSKTDPTGSGSPTAPPTDPGTTDPSTTDPAPTQGNGKVTYTVKVVDQNDQPLAGIMVQFCNGENCQLPIATNEEGIVTKNLKPADYHVTLVELPANYTAVENEVHFGDVTELVLTVNVGS